MKEAASTTEFEAAWATYESLSRHQTELDEIRRLRAADTIARENERRFPVAACANLLDELSSSANAARVQAEAGEMATRVILTPRQPAALRGQLTVEAGSPDEKVNTFLEQAAAMASRALGQLSLVALKAGEQEAAKQTA